MSEKENTINEWVESFYYGDGDEVEVSRLIDEIEDIQTRGATHIQLSIDNEWDSIYFTFYKHRPETEEEKEVRVRREEFNKAMEEEAEIKTLKELKEKYPDV